MSATGYKRKLLAILSADVVGYSRLMGDDEEATVSTITGHRDMMAAIIQQHQGQVIDSPGDNLLSAFSSVTQAVDCAVEIQREMAERNAELPKDRVMEYRIGVNLGEVIEEADRIYGDGVNIAARLESIAEPGGICISGSVYAQTKNKLKLDYEFLGKQAVKNISEPVPIYSIKSLPKTAVQYDANKEPISILSEKPSIAVLPFVNMSHDPEQEYFSDGMSEEIISALAKLEGLKVISRTSAFHFKGKDTDLRTIGEKLKVDHVLEGSVRKAGNKIRITAQLIKVSDDTHLWAGTYDRELEDVFAIQDEIAQAVVESLKVKLFGSKAEPLVKDYTHNSEAYELFLKGKFCDNKWEFKKAIEYMEKAIKTDPNYAPAYQQLAKIHAHIAYLYSLPPWEVTPRISALHQKALEIDDRYAITYAGRGRDKMIEYDWKGAEVDIKTAINLNPGHGDSHQVYSMYLMAIGHVNEAVIEIKRALELDPLSSYYNVLHGFFQCYSGSIDQAIEILTETLELNPNYAFGAWALAIAYGGKGKYEKGISTIQQFGDKPLYQTCLGYLYGKSGKKEEALNILDNFLARSKKKYFSPFLIASVYCGLDEKDKVFEWLDRAFEVRDHHQFWIKVDIVFQNLHSDPRWQEVLRKRNLAN